MNRPISTLTTITNTETTFLTGIDLTRASGDQNIKVAASSLIANSTTASVTLTLPATVGATVSGVVIATTLSLLCVQLTATTTATTLNYVITLYNADPAGGGSIVYQATGITAASYIDNAPFFVTAPASGAIWAQISNIDADAMTATLSLSYVSVA